MKVKVTLELEGWMAKAVLEYAEKLEKNWENYHKMKAEKENGNQAEKSEEKTEKDESYRRVRYRLLQRGWKMCKDMAEIEGKTKDEIWDRMKKEYGIESTKGMKNEDLEKFVEFIKGKYVEAIAGDLE